jgi:HlyD family secretion protein
MVEAGEIVSPGVPVLTVADTRRPYADLFVPQGDIAGIAPGRAAEVHVDALAEPLPARVEYVEQRTEFTPRFLFSEGERPNLVIRVRVRIDDPNRKLSAGLPAFVYLK